MDRSRNNRNVESSFRKLLILLKSEIWNKDIDLKKWSGEETDWQTIYKLAQKNTVASLVYRSICKLPPEFQVSKYGLNKFFLQSTRVKQSHVLINATLSKLVEMYRKEGIELVLLKGQGISELYPNKFTRQCGDIDLYVGEDNFKKACDLAYKWNIVDKASLDIRKHFSFYWGDVNIELHRKASSIFSSRKADSHFQNWTKEVLLNTNEYYYCNGIKILLPELTYNAFFLFYHIYGHYLSSGVGLRQICDFSLFLDRNSDKIDKEKLYSILKAYKLVENWETFGSVLVNYIGLESDKFPFYKNLNSKYPNRIIKAIVYDGNFGEYSPLKQCKSDRYIYRKLYNGIRFHFWIIKKYREIPKGVVSFYINSLRSSLLQIFKDIC